ncbi:hypothetical protein L9F63_023629, partial [Diploptera punctata]
MLMLLAGYSHNPYNGVICNDTILATGVFSSKELWRLSKASIMQGPNGMQAPSKYNKTRKSRILLQQLHAPRPRTCINDGLRGLQPLVTASKFTKSWRTKEQTYTSPEFHRRGDGSGNWSRQERQTSWHSDVDHGLASQHSSVASMSSGGGGAGATASYYQQASAAPQHGEQQSHSQHSPTKYPENGHDTLSDFVHFVCQEAETQETQSQPGPSRSPSKLSQYYPSTMLPPPPPPPMARPVAIIRSTGELTVATANSPPASSTPPMVGGEGSPRESRGPNNALSPPPPVVVASSAAASSSSSVDVVPTSRTVVTSPFSVSREYAFTHIHTQPGQLFSYPSISPVSAMSVSGVISPTNLSLFTSPVTTPRTTPRSTPIPRWNAPFISLDEEYNMITPLMSGNGNNPESSTATLMDDVRERYAENYLERKVNMYAIL